MASNTYHSISTIANDRDLYLPVTALCFDLVSDTLWAGTRLGRVVAYHGTQGIRGVSFPVGGIQTQGQAVIKIQAGDQNIRACGSPGVGSWNKGGVNKWYFPSPDINSYLTTFTSSPTVSHNVIAATTAPELLYVNGLSGTITRRISVPSRVTHLQSSHSLLISGSVDGYLRAYDSRFKSKSDHERPEFSQKAHMSGITGLETSGNLVFTIGLTLRQSRPFPDALVKVYDLRNGRALPPIPFPAGPNFLNILPKRSSSIVVTSSHGLVNIVDASNPTNATEFYQLDVPSYVNSAAISPTGAYMAFGDAEGNIHLMSAVTEDSVIPFNGFDGQPVEWADPVEAPQDIHWTDTTPLNVIGMPYYNLPLLSSWNSSMIPHDPYFPPPVKIPPSVLGNMKVKDFIGYAALPRELRGKRNTAMTPKKDHARFRSGKSQVEPEAETPVAEFSSDKIPRPYRKVEIAYSRFGVEDFDFAFYNRTDFSGLETHITNSYTNALVQSLHYCLPIRRSAQSHTTTNCIAENCLLCELGFVTRMLDDAKGTNCQASNFCRVVGVLTQATNSIALMDFGREDADYASMIQSFHRFLVDHMVSEGNIFPHNPRITSQTKGSNSPAPALLTQILGLDAQNIITCSNCGAVREKENMTHIIDLVYPRQHQIRQARDFASILRNSLIREMNHKATCQTCKQFSNFETRRVIASSELPPVLAVNACVFNEENHRIWLDRRDMFLSPTVEIAGQIDGVDDPEIVVYEIRSIIACIVTGEQSSHLVSIVKVPDIDDGPDLLSPWFIFNDFVVNNVTEEEALSFPGTWKVPAIIYLERVDMRDKLDFSGLPAQIDPSIFTQDFHTSQNRDTKLIKHELLERHELPKQGDLISIDAEFISMQQEEKEVRSDGTGKILRPARLSLARVSVLRGAGRKEGIPFIDDHIHTTEVIVDYLTKYSGVKYGDLNPVMSPHTLVPLKVAYKKLRLLVDLGCIFIGHGLAKDFRIINLFVPPDQVIDTVDLYFIKARQRRLSLKFLSWFVLKQDIQQEEHDSIEDARSALLLYKAYLEFEKQGIFDQKLEELYREGKGHNWKPPVATEVTMATSQSLPIFAQSQSSQAGQNRPGHDAASHIGFMRGVLPQIQSSTPVPMANSVSLGPGHNTFSQFGAKSRDKRPPA